MEQRTDESASELAFVQGRVGNRASPILMEIFDCIRRGNNTREALEDWFRGACLPPVSFRYELKSSSSKDIQRAEEVRDALELAGHMSEQFLDCISLQVAVAREHVNAIRLRSDMSSLPDEILSLVLEDAAFDEHRAKNTVKAATKLSHTCRRFRHLVVRIPSLWNRIANDMPLGMVSVCCDRLAIANAEVSLRDDGYSVSEFIRATTNLSRLWRRFDHEYDSCYDFADCKVLAEETYNLDAPELLELSVRHENYQAEPDQDEEDEDEEGLEDGIEEGAPGDGMGDEILDDQDDPEGGAIEEDHHEDEMDQERFEETLNYYSTWSMPRLSSLKTSNLVPVPFKSPVCLKTLDIAVDLALNEDKRFNSRALTTFLASCEFLEELDLRLGDVNGEFIASPPPVKGCIDLKHLKRATLNFDGCKESIICSIFDAVRFPALSSMELFVWIDYEEEDPDRPDGPIDETLCRVFSHELAFPKLLYLDLKFSIRRYNDPIQVKIPFSSLRSVRNLTLSSHGSELAPIPDGRMMPSLETLFMERCIFLDVDWVTSFLDRLIHQGNLLPSRFTMKGCRRTRFPRSVEPRITAVELTSKKYPEQVDITAGDMLQLVLKN